MLLRFALSTALLVSVPALAAQPPLIPITARAAPESDAAERMFHQWLDIFNSNDRARIKSFYAEHIGDANPQFALENAEDTCGLSLDRITVRSPLALTVLLRQRCLPGLMRFKLVLADAEGAKLTKLELYPLALSLDGATTATVAIARRLAARNEFAGSLIVARGDKTEVAGSWGIADQATHAPITLDTPMFLASAGKMFTAVSVLQLVDAGKIELDAPLGKYLANYPNAEMAKVTIRQLLTHRGGTGDIGILARDDGANRARVHSISDMIQLNGTRPPAFPPGDKDEYSNYGFILLGAVIERVTHDSYYAYVKTHVFEPAGMTASGFPDRDHLKGVAVGYTTYFGSEPRLLSNLATLKWRGASAGGGVASANDILHFFNALRSGKLLSPATFALATSVSATPWYGMGFVVQPGRS